VPLRIYSLSLSHTPYVVSEQIKVHIRYMLWQVITKYYKRKLSCSSSNCSTFAEVWLELWARAIVGFLAKVDYRSESLLFSWSEEWNGMTPGAGPASTEWVCSTLAVHSWHACLPIAAGLASRRLPACPSVCTATCTAQCLWLVAECRRCSLADRLNTISNVYIIDYRQSGICQGPNKKRPKQTAEPEAEARH